MTAERRRAGPWYDAGTSMVRERDGDDTVRMPGNPGESREFGIQPGDVLAGKYRVEHVLGIGGVGVVVAATHLELGERVAIKFLLPAALKQPETVSRFAREARAAVRIKSEHVARVTDVGSLETGAPYMVMEYLEGFDLGQIARQRGPLPVEEAVDYVLQACEAVAEAHGLGIVHRDLKPSNLFVSRRADGSTVVKVLDFGISKLVSRGGSLPEASVTHTATVIGSPLYMSPEQMESTRDVDERSDIWSLGTILYELVAGACPFDADTMPQLCARILRSPPTPLLGYRPDAPPVLQQVIECCLEKDPKRRYANVAELAIALGPLAPRRALLSIQRIVRVIQAAGLTTVELQPPPSDPGSSRFGAATPHSAKTPMTGRAPQHTDASWGETRRDIPRPRRSRDVLAAAALGCVLLGGGVVAFAMNGRVEPAPLTALAGPSFELVAQAVARNAAVPTAAPSSEPAPSATPSAEPSSTPKSKGTKGSSGRGRSAPEPDVLDER